MKAKRKILVADAGRDNESLCDAVRRTGKAVPVIVVDNQMDDLKSISRAMTLESSRTDADNMREFTRQVTSSKKSAVKFLASTGIYDRKGNLKPRFR
jgi:hypothetical protein